MSLALSLIGRENSSEILDDPSLDFQAGRSQSYTCREDFRKGL